MKRILIAFFASLLSMSAFAGNYKITIGFPDASLNGKMAYLTSYDTGDTIQTSTVRGKRCVFKGTADKSYFSRLIIDGQRCGFVVEDGNIAIDWKTKMATGASLNEKLNAFEKSTESMNSEEEYCAAYYKLYEENKDNGIGPWAYYYYLMEKNYNVAQLDSALATVPAYYKGMKRIQNAVANAQAQAATAEGQMFTDFTVKGEDGKDYKLSDYVGKGAYTLVDFWASWCGPCRREIPNIKSLYEKYNGKGMNFLGVAVWDAPADTHVAMKQLNIPWPVIIGNKKLTDPTDKYGIMGIPHIIIFDPQGRIVSRGLQGDDLTKKVNAVMAK